MPVFDFVSQELGIRLGRFMQGKFGFHDSWPAGGRSRDGFSGSKENRKVALGTVFPACLTAFLTGVTEPIEFTFLFLAPWLYWGFHALMAAISFLVNEFVRRSHRNDLLGGVLDLLFMGLSQWQRELTFGTPF
ncbi:PTS transporter subunit EIIC [Mycoplasma sp. ATU-Cv-508]|uniref:PTS transporter subunit EIIC n=1 Tax=Mycoplasma sp. ATU-Cv-508 TaxID=2048001 RepID=UPI000FDE0D8E